MDPGWGLLGGVTLFLCVEWHPPLGKELALPWWRGGWLPVVTAESLYDRSQSWPTPTRGWMQALRSSTPSHWPLGGSSPSPATILCSEYGVGGRALRDRGCGTPSSTLVLESQFPCQTMWSSAVQLRRKRRRVLSKAQCRSTSIGQCDPAAAL